MIGALAALARPLLLHLDPETAHDLTIKALETLPPASLTPDSPRLKTQAFGLVFSNPFGLAAGFDKNARVADRMGRLGFGFVEIGSVTPKPQDGNPRPRLFRLKTDEAAINRFGFNNEGHTAVRARLLRQPCTIAPLGINLGANKDTSDRAADYVRGIESFADIAAYFTINVSSPNTPGLRDLQEAKALDDLLARVLDARDAAAQHHGRKPVLLKIAPDLALTDLDDVIAVARQRGIDALIVSNTTLARPDTLQDKTQAAEAGGLSGKPLFELSTRMLAEAYIRIEQKFPLIGVGGIDSAEAAFAKIQAGATLLQLYTSLVYHGPSLIGRMKHGLLELLDQSNYTRLTDAIGSNVAEWLGGKASFTNRL